MILESLSTESLHTLLKAMANMAREKRIMEVEIMDEKRKPVVQMTGADGNAFAILGRCKEAAWRMDHAEYENFLDEATSGDYDHLLQTVNKYFEVE